VHQAVKQPGIHTDPDWAQQICWLAF